MVRWSVKRKREEREGGGEGEREGGLDTFVGFIFSS